MAKIEATKKLLADLGMPVAQQSDLCALTILAMGDTKETANLCNPHHSRQGCNCIADGGECL